ncbi:MAG: DUF1275 family protein [Phycisphaerales bacterium]|nr:DUF1275 family protein [Phycisphaerales bacterium]
MFVSQAHSYRQQARLAITLAWVAGCTNAIAVLACGEAVSHATGHTTQLGIDLARAATGSWDTLVGSSLVFLVVVLLAFGVGAMLAGFVIELGRRQGWESVYVLPMSLEAACLAAFAIVIEYAGDMNTSLLRGLTGLAALAMGMQNATITRISNGVVRTTHVTGVLTDLGVEVGHALVDAMKPGRPTLADFMRVATSQNARRIGVLVSILGSFVLGAGLGAALFTAAPRLAMFPPVLFLLWTIYQDAARPIAEIEPSDLIRGAGLSLPAGIAVLHLRPDPRRSGVQRLPGFETWYERLDPGTRVVILDLGDVPRLSVNSIIELRAAAAYLRRHGQRLILAGITKPQWEGFHTIRGGERLEPGEICPDLELAIARGINELASLPREAPPSGTRA